MARPDTGVIVAVATPTALAIIGVGAIIADLFVARLLGVALVTAAVGLALPPLIAAYPFTRGIWRVGRREIDLEPLARRVIPPALLVMVACALLAPLLLGQMPRSQDHTVHLTRAWIFLHELIGRGRLTGWSSYWFAGYPAGQLYPPGSDLWVTTFRLLGLGLTEWETSYAQAYLAFTVVGTLALYWLAVRATGSRLAATVTGLLWLLDPGAYREGGWSFTVYWGVWSQVLGLVFAALALAALDRALERPSVGHAAVAAAAVGFSLLGHPMSLVTLAVWVGSYLLVRWLGSGWRRGDLALSLGIAVWGGALAAWWLLPFVSRGEWTIRVPALWRSMDDAAEGILAGAPFENQLPLVGALALVGVAAAIRRRQPLALAMVVSVAVFLFTSTSTAFTELRLAELSAAFERIIYQRFSLPAKVAWFLLAGSGLSVIVSALAREGEAEESGKLRRLALVMVLSLAGAPFLLHGGEAVGRLYLRGVGAVQLGNAEPDMADYRRFLEWSRQRWEQREVSFYRIAYLQPRNEHFMADAPVYNHTPAYKVGWTPATTFRHRPESDDPEVLRALSVRYVVSRRPVPGRHLTLERSFGSIRVYRLRSERLRRFTLNGPGRATEREFGEESLAVEVEGVGEGTALTFHLANYEDWEATLDGERLAPIREAPIYDDRYPMFIEVEVPHDGLVELRFRRPPLRVGAEVISGLAALALVLVLAVRRWGWLAATGRRLLPWLRRLGALAPWAVGVALVALTVLTIARWAGGPRDELERWRWSLSDHVDEATAGLLRGDELSECERQRQKLVCPGPRWSWVGVKQVKVGIVERPCIWAHPRRGAELEISFPEVPLGAVLTGRHGLSDFAATQTPEGTPVRLEVEVEGGPSARFLAPNEVGWRRWRLDTGAAAGQRRRVTFRVTSDDDAGRQYCFDGGVLEPR